MNDWVVFCAFALIFGVGAVLGVMWRVWEMTMDAPDVGVLAPFIIGVWLGCFAMLLSQALVLLFGWPSTSVLPNWEGLL